MNNSYITIIKEKRTDLSRKRIPLNQNECTADFRMSVPFEQNLHFQMIQSKVFISDCGEFFDTIATFIQTIAGCVVMIGKTVAQISNGISNPVVAEIIYWLIRILVCGGWLVGAGILLAFIGIKIAGVYKKCCWDMITLLVTIISMEIAIYFGDWIKTRTPINLLFFLLFVQLVYVAIRWYMKGWRDTRSYY